MPEKPTYEELERRVGELEAAEVELQESRDKYQTLFEALGFRSFFRSI
jgi:exonuclease VII small subunit